MKDTIFKPREFKKADYSDIKIDSRRFKAVDELQEEEADNFTERQDVIAADLIKDVLERMKVALHDRQEPKLYTRADMIRAFVQGATWAVYPFDNSEEAEKKARFLLERGWLGKEEE
jgi:hypothetical protein